ncbi:HEAT repeat domain-containing protein [Chitinophaga vietnamensis]|uniref:HEAT repeat domain-containing protein n=1 Tax=Chitinophaga vietnamensis TaxID=2593957 RepID=UPI0011777AA4|nr:HEAT repeat domain-containing protein [Chitinophaga vietnamensis]
MEDYLQDLIDRMNGSRDLPLAPGHSSSESASWAAFREAEQISDTNFIPLLTHFIGSEKTAQKRDRAYFILGHIARNTGNTDITTFLISRIVKEDNRYVCATLLDMIAPLEKPAGTDLSPLINATQSSTWQVRQSAIKALGNCNSDEATQALLEIIENSHDEYDLIYANAAIATSGNKACIPALMKLVDHKKQAVSGTALHAILALSDDSLLPFFTSQLEQGKNKFTALTGVVRYGNESAIAPIIKRVKQLLAKQRAVEAIDSSGKTEIIIALEFLVRYAPEHPPIKKLYELLRHQKYDLLWDNEKKWLHTYRHHFETIKHYNT